MKIIDVLIDNNSKSYKYYDNDIELSLKDKVVVESGDIITIGEVSGIDDTESKDKHKTIVRKATKEDLDKWNKNIENKDNYIATAQKINDDLNLEMKIKNISFAVDNKTYKIIYTAPDRVDFREFVKHASKKFGKRISMHQISSRVLASKICGIGICGRELCCCKVLKKMPSVKINALKNQGISISSCNNEGACGKLKCCYNYENDNYTKLRNEMPGAGDLVSYKGAKYKVNAINYFTKEIKLIDREKNILDVKVDDVKWSNN